MTIDLKAELAKERLATYARLRGGFPIPMAGTVYWGALAWLGHVVDAGMWTFWAFVGSGSIFPLALLFAALFRNPFMKDRSAVSSVLVPAFLSMLLFWPMAVAAWWTNVQLVPLILAIGLSIHWPVIGWSYGRTGLFAAHSIVRAVIVFLIWQFLPDLRFTVLPAAVAVIYALTVVAIYVDSGSVKRRLAGEAG